MQTTSNPTRMKGILLDVFQHTPPTTKQHQIRKHHWVLGSLVILMGSWITHTTTASISDNISPDQTRDFARLLDEKFLADIPERINELADPNAQPFDYSSTSSTLKYISPIQPTRIETLASIPSIDTISVLASLPNPDSSLKEITVNETALEIDNSRKVEQDLDLKEVFHTVKRGETLGLIFKKLSLDLSIPHYISQHEIAKQLASLSIGKTLTFKVDDSGDLREIIYPSSELQELIVKLDNNQVAEASTISIPFTVSQQHVSGEITTSLYDSALEAGLTNSLIMEMTHIFGWDIDFVQDLRSGDHFHVIHEEYNSKGQKIANGNIIAAEFTTQGNTYRTVRFENSEGNVNYYTPEGDSMLGTFLRSPVEFSRISSRFGARKHPILKTWRAHNGVDYAAATGTPIYATADGSVIQAGTNGGYGKTVTLRHAGRFTTLYAHMTKFGDGIRKGSIVKQGDIIGYVGSTGLATGPHLHYEFRVDGVHQDPLSFKTPKASSIAETDRAEFDKFAKERIALLDSVIENQQLAKADENNSAQPKL